MELRSKLQTLLEYEGEMPRKAAVELADAILDLPEIKEAQDKIKELERVLDRMWDQAVEEGERD